MKKKGKKPNALNAYQAIKELILENRILPGATITEEALAEQLDIGRTPIREALMRLEQEGLVVTENRRKRVFTLEIPEIQQIYELKMCIEGRMAAYAAERASKEALAEIAEVMHLMEEHAKTLPVETRGASAKAWFRDWIDLDERLHRSIYLAGDNPTAWEIIKGFNTKIHRFKVGLLTLQGRVAISVKEHREFVDAILERKPEAAQQLMTQHLHQVYREMIKLMEIFGGQGSLKNASSSW